LSNRSLRLPKTFFNKPVIMNILNKKGVG